MKTYTNLLDIMKDYPQDYADTAIRRSETTPSSFNRNRHKMLACALKSGDWDAVECLFNDQQYRKGLEGVVICVNSYSDLDSDIILQGLDLFREGKLIPVKVVVGHKHTKDGTEECYVVSGTCEMGYAKGGVAWESDQRQMTIDPAEGSLLDNLGTMYAMERERQRGITIRPQLMEDIEESQIDPEDD